MTAMVEARNLTLRYADAARPVLNGLTFTLQRGERVLLLGPSGSGKSSLALCLNGIIPHSIDADIGGRLRVLDRDPSHTAVAQLARHVGMVFQNPASQFCTLTVGDEIAFGLENLRVPRREMERRIATALGWVGLPGAQARLLGALSGGEQQRVALAAALAMEPELLVLDEVTANLDPAGATEVIATIGALARAHPARTLLIIAHHVEPLLELVTRVWVLDAHGRLRHDGAPGAIFAANGQALAELGVWQPAACELAQTLQCAGIELTPFPLTLPEVVQQVCDRPPAWPVAARWACPGTSRLPLGARPAVELRQVGFSYPRGRRTLCEISLRIGRGEVVAVVGANAAGKTTLAQLMAGIIRPQRGSVLVFGQDTAQVPLRALARRCGFVFQNPEHQFVAGRVDDEIAFGLRRMGATEAELAPRVEELLRRLRLDTRRAANPFTLSEGQKRRLSVATMLVHRGDLLVLDEPTLGQDAATTAELVHELRRLNRSGVTLVLVTHDMELVWALAQRVVVLSAGRVVADGPVERIFADQDLLQGARVVRPPRAVVAQALQQARVRLAGHDQR